MKTPNFSFNHTKPQTSLLKTLFVALLLGLPLLSCSSSDDGGGTPIIPTPQPVSENVWSLDNYSFTKRISAQNGSSYGNGNPFLHINVDSNVMPANGKFKTCSLNIIFNTNTEGTYLVKSQNTTVSNTAEKYLQISCTVTDMNGNGAIYDSVDTTIPATVTLVNGKFVVTINQDVTLNKVLDDDLDAPQTVTFKCNKAQ